MTDTEVGRVLFGAADIARRVAELGRDISSAYGATPITVVGVLKGAVFFLADLVRGVDTPLTYDFLQVSSYGSGTSADGPPELRLTTRTPLAGRHVLLVEDIVDTGRTLALVRAEILRHRPASLRLAVLLDKRARRQVAVPLDWVGFVIPDCFVVGYGLDHDQRWRNLPHLAVLGPLG
jgi:hypoxanthine phosphoribosyltransferase